MGKLYGTVANELGCNSCIILEQSLRNVCKLQDTNPIRPNTQFDASMKVGVSEAMLVSALVIEHARTVTVIIT
jgi:hypothetical protein